jgi:putative oxidoreductase
VAFIEGFFTLVGRILLVAIFLGAAIGMIQTPQEYQNKMRGAKIEQVYPQDERTIPVLMWAAVGCLVVGGISVLFGYKARFGAFLLILFLAATTYFFHPFWNYASDREMWEKQLVEFLKNIAVGGGLFIVLARGAGRWSVDGVRPAYDDF